MNRRCLIDSWFASTSDRGLLNGQSKEPGNAVAQAHAALQRKICTLAEDVWLEVATCFTLRGSSSPRWNSTSSLLADAINYPDRDRFYSNFWRSRESVS